jgi:NADPH:quinone reductase-like Zn-dependent oxidoreductase
MEQSRETMKAILWTSYGPPDVLQLRDVEKPMPKENEVLVKIHAATVTAGDCELRRLKFPLWLALPMRVYIGIRKPHRVRILGQDLAGEVEAVGSAVTRFKPGDQVFGTTGFGFGAYAEHICLPSEPELGVLAHKPANMTYEEAATVPTGGIEALHFLRQANIQPGESVLIIGAGGSIGTVGVQLAKSYGAEVTGVDRTEKLDMLLELGADHVIDYTQEDFAKRSRTYDVIFDVAGRTPLSYSVQGLRENGRLLLANPRIWQMIRGVWISSRDTRKVIFGSASQTTEYLVHLKGLIEAGKLRSIIDRRYPLVQTADAHRYVETGQKKGNVVITVG